MNIIAVVLVNYNGIKDTDECIRSIRQSDIKADIVIVDNSYGNEEAALLQKEHPDMTVIANQENIGFAAANNAGIRWDMKRDYEYVMLLNNDTVIESDIIRLLIRKADKRTVTVPAIYYYSQPDALWYGGGNISKWLGKNRHLKLREGMAVTYATGCCMMLHRDIIMNAGMLDERYFMYCEDFEYSLRLAENHISIIYVPEAKLFHKVGHSSGGPLSPLSIYYLTRNRLHCINEHKDAAICQLFFGILLLIRAVHIHIRGKDLFETKWFYGVCIVSLFILILSAWYVIMHPTIYYSFRNYEYLSTLYGRFRLARVALDRYGLSKFGFNMQFAAEYGLYTKSASTYFTLDCLYFYLPIARGFLPTIYILFIIISNFKLAYKNNNGVMLLVLFIAIIYS